MLRVDAGLQEVILFVRNEKSKIGVEEGVSEQI